MSPRLLSLSPDLKRLVDDGYDVQIVGGYLVLRDVPFVTGSRRVRRGSLVSRLDLAGDRTVEPRDHTTWFMGGTPHSADGRPLGEMLHGRIRRDLGHGLVVEHMLCSRPFDGEFRDFHAKMTTFADQLSVHARMIDPSATARVGQVVVGDSARSCFAYVDTGSARHGLGAYNAKLAGLSVGIIGLGGTGGYILDLIAKCPVARIHLFDDDRFDQHSSFRCPGAASLGDLRARRTKVDHLVRIYSRMHTGIVSHDVRLNATNARLLDHVDFAFLAVDSGMARRNLMEELERRGLSFIDAGIGLEASDEGLSGAVRVTTSTTDMRDHVHSLARVPMGAAVDDVYGSQAQTADLNMLAAAMAVIRFKKHFGFYADLEREHHSVFQVDGAQWINADRLGRKAR